VKKNSCEYANNLIIIPITATPKTIAIAIIEPINCNGKLHNKLKNTTAILIIVESTA
jgi:hypothetical protein